MALVTRVITNAGDPLVAEDGTPQENVKITFQLVDEYGQPTDTWDASTDAYERVLPIKVSTYTDADGEFSIALWPNDRGSDVTLYKCSVRLAGVRDFYASLASGVNAISWAEFMASGAALTTQELSQLAAHENQDGLHLLPIQSLTYLELVALHDAESLVPGRQYLINDFRTVYRIDYYYDSELGRELHEWQYGAVEPLILTAISASVLDHVAFSTIYPDDIIHYTIEDGTYNNYGTGDPLNSPEFQYGRITYRHEPLRNLTMRQDWRAIKFRLWEHTQGSGQYVISNQSGITIDRDAQAYFDFYTFPSPTTVPSGWEWDVSTSTSVDVLGNPNQPQLVVFLLGGQKVYIGYNQDQVVFGSSADVSVEDCIVLFPYNRNNTIEKCYFGQGTYKLGPCSDVHFLSGCVIDATIDNYSVTASLFAPGTDITLSRNYTYEIVGGTQYRFGFIDDSPYQLMSKHKNSIMLNNDVAATVYLPATPADGDAYMVMDRDGTAFVVSGSHDIISLGVAGASFTTNGSYGKLYEFTYSASFNAWLITKGE